MSKAVDNAFGSLLKQAEGIAEKIKTTRILMSELQRVQQVKLDECKRSVKNKALPKSERDFYRALQEHLKRDQPLKVVWYLLHTRKIADGWMVKSRSSEQEYFIPETLDSCQCPVSNVTDDPHVAAVRLYTVIFYRPAGTERR
jgi:hypothetical protein